MHPKLAGLLESGEFDWDNPRHREAYLRAWVNDGLPKHKPPRPSLPPSTLPLTVGAPAEASAIPDPGPWRHADSRRSPHTTEETPALHDR